jgi:phage terminase large subunit
MTDKFMEIIAVIMRTVRNTHTHSVFLVFNEVVYIVASVLRRVRSATGE